MQNNLVYIGRGLKKENLVIVHREHLFVYFHGKIRVHFIIHRGKSLVCLENAVINSSIQFLRIILQNEIQGLQFVYKCQVAHLRVGGDKNNKPSGIIFPDFLRQGQARHIRAQGNIQKIDSHLLRFLHFIQDAVGIFGDTAKLHVQVFHQDNVFNHLLYSVSFRFHIFTYINLQHTAFSPYHRAYLEIQACRLSGDISIS